MSVEDALRGRDVAVAEEYLLAFCFDGEPVEQWNVLRALTLLLLEERGYSLRDVEDEYLSTMSKRYSCLLNHLAWHRAGKGNVAADDADEMLWAAYDKVIAKDPKYAG